MIAKVRIIRRRDYECSDGRAALYAVVCIDGTKARIPVGVSVCKEEWDPVKEKVRGRSAESTDKNLIIENVRSQLNDILVRSRLSGEHLTKERLISAYRNPGSTTNFVDYAFRHLDELRPAMQPETIRHHMAVLKKLQAYAPNIQISEVTTEWLRVYAAYLKNAHGNNPTTVNKNMSTIRMHFKAAIRAGLAKNNPFEAYRFPLSDPAVVYLTEEELNSLIRLYHSNTLPDNENDALRFFLFMTFTAMHISDARALRIEQIIGGEIHYRRIKTKTRVIMPLSNSAAKLVKYYQEKRVRGKLFLKLPADQTFNRLIKVVCQRAGITKAVSAKTGRHTFATLYYIKNSGDIGTLSKLLGHTNVTTTMIYAHILKESRLAGVSAFDNML